MAGDDKSSLLSELSLDKNHEVTETGFGVPTLAFASIAAALLSALCVWWLGLGAVDESEIEARIRSELAQQSPASAIATTAKESIPEFANSEEVLNASGYITARRLATVSAETMGLITSVSVEEGMEVEAGQILATLDSSIAQVNLELANARVDVLHTRISSTETDLAESQRVLNRISALGKESYVSEAQLTRAQTDVARFKSILAASRAEIKSALLSVRQQQELLDNHTIRAPFGGVVTVKNAQPGEIVAPSSAGGGFTRTGICTIVDMNSLEIEVDVNEAYIGRVTSGQAVKANLDAYPNWDIPASVIAIIPTANRAKATVRVRIKLEVSDTRILPDMGVKVAFLKLNNKEGE